MRTGLSKLFIGLLLACFAFALASQRRRPMPQAPQGFLLGKIAGVVGGEGAFHHTVVLVRDDVARGGLPVKEAMLITVGGTEGTAIAMGLANRSFVRPLTHDLMLKIMNRSGVEVRGVYIHSLQNETFFARLELVQNGNKLSFDCRPSDAIAIAVRSGAPVWIEERLFSRAAIQLPLNPHAGPSPKGPDESL